MLYSWLGKAALLGLGALAVQRAAVGSHFAEGVRRRRYARQGISILKPLCGVDDGLPQNLRAFAELPYTPFEVLLGVESEDDPAFELAQMCSRRWPHMRTVLREGEPGCNPKVNQLCTLARYASHPILLISDSGIRPARGYLDEMSAMFEDPRVGLATNVYAGQHHETLGALFDNLHMATNSAQHLAAKKLLGKDFVLGGSQALRREVLNQLGGFERYKDVLAEDYLIGRDVARLGWHIETGRLPVFNTAPRRTVGSFHDRFARWGTMQATAMGSPLPAVALGLFNPIALAGLAAVLAPAGAATSAALGALGAITAGKVALDMSTAKAVGVRPLGLREAAAIPIKDAVVFGAWAKGLVNREVDWRGKKFKVSAGTQLSRLPADAQTPTAEDRAHLGSAHRARPVGRLGGGAPYAAARKPPRR